jgi:3-deoxy-7-phosphoheptulonate synthase
MIILMRSAAPGEDLHRVVREAEATGLRADVLEFGGNRIVALSGDAPADPARFESLPGVAQVVGGAGPFRLAAREARPEGTVVRAAGVPIGAGECVVIAGPCAVESEVQLLETARFVRQHGARLLRGGAFKPRTSPYSFQGLGLPALRLLAKAREETGLGIVTEALDEGSLAAVEEVADVIQIGTRNMHNAGLLRAAARTGKPILLKRGMAATLEELLMAAEYVLAEGNPDVVLCERGIRTFSRHSRYTLDLSVIPAAHELSHLPIVVDPSHATGRRDRVAPMARAAVAAGADGLLLEVHPTPERSRSDGPQALLPAQFAALVPELRALAAALAASSAPGREVAR